MHGDNVIKSGRLSSNIFSTFGRQLLGVVFQLLLVVLLARVLGSEANGLFAIALMLPTFLVVLFSFGIPAANVYFLGRKQLPEAEILQVSMVLWLALTILGLILGAVVIVFYAETVFPNVNSDLLWLSYIIFPLGLLIAFLGSILQGQNNFKGYNATLLAPPISTFLIALIVVWNLEYGVDGAILSWVCGQSIGILVALSFFKNKIKFNKLNCDSYIYFEMCLNYAWKAHVGNLLQYTNYKIDTYSVNYFIGSSSSGIYIVSLHIAEQLWLLSHAVTSVLLPRLSGMYNEEHERSKLTISTARLVLYFSISIAIIIAIVVKEIILYFLGLEYYQSISIIYILLPGVVAFNYARVLASDIAARGKPQINMWIAGIILCLNILGNILLIPRYGVQGAAYSTTATFIFSTILTTYIYSNISKTSLWKMVLISKSDWYLVKRIFTR